jgi:hypothetical protein
MKNSCMILIKTCRENTLKDIGRGGRIILRKILKR